MIIFSIDKIEVLETEILHRTGKNLSRNTYIDIDQPISIENGPILSDIGLEGKELILEIEIDIIFLGRIDREVLQCKEDFSSIFE